MGAEFRGRRNQAWGCGLEVGGARHGVEFEGRRGQALGWELSYGMWLGGDVWWALIIQVILLLLYRDQFYH